MLPKLPSGLVHQLKTYAKGVATTFGVEVRNRGFYHVDAFADQVALLKGNAVRNVVDGGANVGNVTARYRELFPDATVFAFEPGDAPARDFQARFVDDPKVKLLKLAVSDSVGSATFNVGEASVLSSLLPSAPKAERYMGLEAHRSQPVQIDTVTLDDFAKNNGVESIDVLKLDIQGAEGKALAGARELLAQARIRLVYSEVLFGDLYAGQAYFHDLSKTLHDHGYKLYGLYNLVQGTDGTLSYGDAIFMNPEIASALPSLAR